MARKILLLAALALIALPSAASAYLPAGFIGISPQNPGSAKDFALMREAGIGSVRLPLNWNSIQGEGSLDFEWGSFDHEVTLAAEAGIRVMPFVLGSPSWVAPDWTVLPVRSSFQRWAWRSFLRAAAERYGPGGSFWEEDPELEDFPINKWEIWNEENIVSFAADPSPGPFAALVRISGQVLHSVNPGARVIVGGLFGRPLQIPPNVASGDYLNRFYQSGNVKPYFDGVALHPYVADAKAMGAQLANLRRIMAAHGDGRTPIYLTELGWGSQSGPTRWERGLYGQANQLTKAFEMLSEQRVRWHVAGLWWFTWTDETGGCAFCRSAGLLTQDRKAKPAWYRFNAWTGGDPDAVPRASFLEESSLGEEAVVVPGN